MLKRKLYRDLRRNLSQFFVIFLMVLLSVMVFSGVHAYMDGMRVSSEEIYEEYNLADMWLTGEGFSKEDLQKILENENVQAADRRLTVTGSAADMDDVTLELNFLESNDVCRMYLFDGEAFDPGNTDGVWVDKEFADHHDLKTGDTLPLTYANYSIDTRIAGIVETPDHAYSVKDSTEIFPDHNSYGYVYLSYRAIPEDVLKDAARGALGLDTGTDEVPADGSGSGADSGSADGSGSGTDSGSADGSGSCADTDSADGTAAGAGAGSSLMNSLFGGLAEVMLDNTDLYEQVPFPYVMVDLKDPARFDETKAQLEEDVSSIIAVTGRTELASWAGYNSEVEEGETYAFVFTALFLFIAILSVITTMHRFIRNERTQIGTLKALGYRRSRIVRLYISYNLVLSIVAAVLGVIMGALTIGRFFLSMEMEYFEMPEAHLAVLPIVYITAALSVAVIVLVTWLSCRKILNEPASQALRTEMPKVKNTNFTLTTRGIFRRASTVTRWNLRDMGRNKGRTIAGIVGIMGCAMLVITALGMYDTIQEYLRWQFDTIHHYHSYMLLSQDYTDEEYGQITAQFGNESSQTLALELQEKDGTTSAQMLFASDAQDAFRFTGHDKQVFRLTDEGFYVTEKLAKTLGIGPGDEITWHIYGEDEMHTAKIAGTYRDPQNQRFACTRKYLESLGVTYRADTIYSQEQLDRSSVPDGAEAIQTKDGLEKGVRSMLDRMTSVIFLFIGFAALLAVVILYNLGILSFSEKQYQFATLKVLGYRTKPLRKIFNQQGAILSAIAILLGMPAGYWMVSYIFQAALSEQYDFPAVIYPLSYLIAGASIFLVSLLINDLMSRKIRKIDMVSSLKANE